MSDASTIGGAITIFVVRMGLHTNICVVVHEKPKQFIVYSMPTTNTDSRDSQTASIGMGAFRRKQNRIPSMRFSIFYRTKWTVCRQTSAENWWKFTQIVLEKVFGTQKMAPNGQPNRSSQLAHSIRDPFRCAYWWIFCLLFDWRHSLLWCCLAICQLFGWLAVQCTPLHTSALLLCAIDAKRKTHRMLFQSITWNSSYVNFVLWIFPFRSSLFIWRFYRE